MTTHILTLIMLFALAGCAIGQEATLERAAPAETISTSAARLPTDSIRCFVPGVGSIQCFGDRTITPGYNGIVDETSATSKCSHWAWSEAYTGSCAVGSPCEVVTEDGGYLEGTCD